MEMSNIILPEEQKCSRQEQNRFCILTKAKQTIYFTAKIYIQIKTLSQTDGAVVLSGSETSGLQGVTLKVYLYVVKKKGLVGPRDVMRGVHLSSPSVAYRHLQKLENMGLLTKDELGNYVVKEKVAVRGYVWLGRHLVPNPLIYSLLFLCILITQLVVLAIHFSVETEQFKIFFLLLTLITAAALFLFLIEGLRMLTKIRARKSD
jgi:DNA-binding transcriptional ArsR family regulator